MITTVVLLAHVLLAFALIVLILVQHGKGADAGAAFGSGASSTVFGSQGTSSFLSRVTKWLALFFFLTSGTLAYLSREQQAPAPSVMDVPPAIEQQATPDEAAGDTDLPPVEAPVEEGAADESGAGEQDKPEPPPSSDDGKGAN